MQCQLVLYDIHALQNRFYFREPLIPRLESCVPLLLAALQEDATKGEKQCICFPDDGAMKRFKSSFKGFELALCHKIRVGDQRLVELKDGDVGGRHCIIVDDLVHTGGTLLSCAEALWAAGAADVSMYVTHAILEEESWKN